MNDFTPTLPENPPGLVGRIRRLASSGAIVYTDHARERMKTRKIAEDDVAHMLSYAACVKEEKSDSSDPTYSVQDRADGCRSLRAVIILAESRILIKSAMWRQPRH